MKNIFFSLTALCGATTLYAAEPNMELLKNSLNTGAQIQSVKPAVISGFYEVQINGQIVYLSEDGEKIISGDIYDLKKKISYTEQTKTGLRKAAIGTVKDEDKVIYKAKDEKYKVTVFTDITCGYCVKLHEHIADYNDAGITVEYLAFPRAGIGSQPQKDMQNIWCASDKTAALTKAKLSRKTPSKSCEGSQVVEQFLLGQDLGVNATPTMIFSDGELQAGYIKPDDLLSILQLKFPN